MAQFSFTPDNRQGRQNYLAQPQSTSPQQGQAGWVNPVTGRPMDYASNRSTGWGNYQSTYVPDRSNYTPQVNKQLEQVKQNVAQGSDFTGYQNQLDKLLQDTQHNKYQQQLDQLLRDPNSFQQTPGYQSAMSAGQEAINRRAAASGAGESGNVLAELAKFSGGLASQEYGNQVGRLAGLNQQAQQQYGNQVNSLADMMRGSQQFGLQAGYYKPPTPNAYWAGGALNVPNPQPSWY